MSAITGHSDLAVGECSDYPPRSSPELEAVLEDLVGVPVGRVDIPALAGPNDLCQLLATLEGWQKFGLAILALYGTELVKEAGKASWKKLANAPEVIARLAAQIRRKHEAGDAVSIGLIEPTLDPQLRCERVRIDDHDPNEVARCLWIFSNCAPVVARLIAEEVELCEGAFVNIQISITDEGHLIVHVDRGDGAWKQAILDGLGNLVSETEEDHRYRGG